MAGGDGAFGKNHGTRYREVIAHASLSGGSIGCCYRTVGQLGEAEFGRYCMCDINVSVRAELFEARLQGVDNASQC